MSDNSLKNSSSSGQSDCREEFMRLYAVNSRRVYGYIRSLVPLHEDADDVFQETCVVLWRRFDEYEFDTNFYAWARRIAYFQVMSIRKRHASSRLQFNEAFLDAVHEETELQSDKQKQHWTLLEHCLCKLRDKDRHLILQRYAKKQTVKTLAEQIGRPVGAVYKSLVRIEHALLKCVHESPAPGGEEV